jgi:hypothetical protein
MSAMKAARTSGGGEEMYFPRCLLYALLLGVISTHHDTGADSDQDTDWPQRTRAQAKVNSVGSANVSGSVILGSFGYAHAGGRGASELRRGRPFPSCRPS